jgi:hypothetical protein
MDVRGRPAKDAPLIGDIILMVPADDVENPGLSIVIPALNEEITIRSFVAWCKDGIAGGNVGLDGGGRA